MKIIRVSNYDHDDWRGDQRVVASNIKLPSEAKIMCEALNAAAGEHSEDHFQIVSDEHALKPDWKP